MQDAANGLGTTVGHCRPLFAVVFLSHTLSPSLSARSEGEARGGQPSDRQTRASENHLCSDSRWKRTSEEKKKRGTIQSSDRPDGSKGQAVLADLLLDPSDIV